MKEIKKGDWIEVNIKGYVEECKVRGFNERGIDVWDGVKEEYYIEWEEIDSVKKLGEEGLFDKMSYDVSNGFSKKELKDLYGEENVKLYLEYGKKKDLFEGELVG